MILVIQRVKQAAVHIEGQTQASIAFGMVVFVGIGKDDSQTQVVPMAEKIKNMRIFNDAAGKMNCAAHDVGAQALVVSQFTLLADCYSGNRPSFSPAAPPEVACELYATFVQALRDTGLTVQEGVFGANMQVELINDGPVTFILNSI